MGDLRTDFKALASDYALAAGDLATDEGLKTAVGISLFTDRRAAPDDPYDDDPRGWWGDAYPDAPGRRLGSRLWMLARRKQTRETLQDAVAYAREALAWLTEDGIARSVTVAADWVERGVLAMEVEIARANGPISRFLFRAFWEGVPNAV